VLRQRTFEDARTKGDLTVAGNAAKLKADVALVSDTALYAEGIPTLCIGLRGLIYMELEATGPMRDLHSGLYGGAALNALHALIATLSSVLARDGVLPEALRAGIAPPTDEERAAWGELVPGPQLLEEAGASSGYTAAGEEFYLRTTAEPALDVHGIAGGSPVLQKTVLPVAAEANLSIRLAPGQDVDEIAAALEALLRDAAPEGAELEVTRTASAPPGLVPPDAPAVQLGLDAFEKTFGRRPLLVRSGGSLPIVPALVDKGIPTIITGFALPESNIHSPNERLLAEFVPLGLETARELFRSLSALSG